MTALLLIGELCVIGAAILLLCVVNAEVKEHAYMHVMACKQTMKYIVLETLLTE